MLSQKPNKFLSATALIIGISYPFIVYFGISAVSPTITVSIVLLLLAVRFVILRNTISGKQKLLWPALAALGIMTVVAFLHAAVAVKLYPVAISLLLGVAFFWSLIKPPSTIEMIARITEPDLDEKGVRYTRKVTIVWIGFFIFNAAIASWTVAYGTLEQWTLYNGLISYCLIGLLLGGEYLVRRKVRVKDERFGSQ